YSTPRVAAIYPSAPHVVLIATGHNNRGAASSPTAYLAGIDSFVTALHKVYPDTLPLIASQNPRFDPAWYVEEHYARQIELRSYAMRNGYGYVPVMEEFLSRPDYGASLIDLDGVHPTTGDAAGTGARFWADAFQAHLDARALVPRNSLPDVLHRLG